MTLRLSPDLLAAAYDFLRQTDPFKGWKLPPAEEIGFGVTRDRLVFADFSIDENGIPLIRLSEVKHGHTVTVLSAMAHEMTHLRQHLRGERKSHGKQYERIVRRICDIHGFDLKAF